MPRRHRLKLDKSEATTPVATSLPLSVVAFLDQQSQRTLVPRASFIRAAIIAQLERDGRLGDDADDVEAV